MKVSLPLLIASKLLFLGQSLAKGVPDIGGLSTRVDLSELAPVAQAASPATGQSQFPTNDLQALPARFFADLLHPPEAKEVFKLELPAGQWLVAPDARNADTAISQLMTPFRGKDTNALGPLEIRLHSDNKISLALALNGTELQQFPDSLDLSPAAAGSWLCTRISKPTGGRTSPEVLEGVRMIREDARKRNLKLHTGDIMLIPFQKSAGHYLLAMQIR